MNIFMYCKRLWLLKFLLLLELTPIDGRFALSICHLTVTIDTGVHDT
jgi:hypothetical protein